LGRSTCLQTREIPQRLASGRILTVQRGRSRLHRQKVSDFSFLQHYSYRSPCNNITLYRFFETEGIAVLTMLVSQYKITVKEEPQFAAETFEQRKSRLLDCVSIITLTYVLLFDRTFTAESDHGDYRPNRVPLVFTRRT